jgi:hypothetical protein
MAFAPSPDVNLYMDIDEIRHAALPYPAFLHGTHTLHTQRDLSH